MKILVIQQKMIGDVLTSTVICESLKLHDPSCIVHYLVNTSTEAVVKGNPFIDQCIVYKPKRKSKLSNLLKLGQSIRANNYDVIIDAYSKLSSNVISLMSGADIRISKKKSYSKSVYTHTIEERKKNNLNIPLSIYNRIRLLKPLKLKLDYSIEPKIYLAQTERDQAKDFLRSHGLNLEQPIFMIGVLGSAPNKSYPAEFMAMLLDDMVKVSPECQILFNYTPSQLKDAEHIYELCQNQTKKQIHLKTYAQDLRMFLTILSQCDALIGNEGGTTNMAKALNIPTFTIFSPWIRKEAWNIKDGTLRHMSFHLKDFEPQIYDALSLKEAKERSIELYKVMKPELFIPHLRHFLKEL